MLFENGQDVDFILVEERAAAALVHHPDAKGLFSRGYCLLLDRMDMWKLLPQKEQTWTVPKFPDEKTYHNLVNDFWYHVVWTKRKLLRGELWTAKFCVDSHMKRRLLTVIEWREQARQDADCDTWFHGRFLEQWAGEDVKQALKDTFAHYSRADIERALESTMELFSRLAKETADALGYTYPKKAETAAKDLIARLTPPSWQSV